MNTETVPTAIEMLASIVAARGKVKTVRVSSAQARGKAKAFAYWGQAWYELRLTAKGEPCNYPVSGASSDRRSKRLAEQDARESGRVYCHAIGRLTDADARAVLEVL